MNLSSRYFTVYIFAAFMLGFSVMVAVNTDAAERTVERLVVDGNELIILSQRAYHAVDLDEMGDILVRLHAAGVYMPTALLGAVGKELQNVAHRTD
ncbi:hypothetical protein [Labrenzia sp. CE80]|uniref:hypothetical protein n=1 Tax=Labrenzia sp. CE80 TaxID=1788986 RepID=UPI00129B55C4|nr:hypothetical protein [Labrenzia sp. CE80]